MLRILAGTALLVTGLAGCALGIDADGKSPHGHYQVEVGYRAAYETAMQQARQCLTGKDAYTVRGQIDDVSRKATVRVIAPFTSNDIARVEIAALDTSRSDLHIAMWGRSIWNGDAVIAMRDAIRFGVPSCVSYMPSDRNDPVRAPK